MTDRSNGAWGQVVSRLKTQAAIAEVCSVSRRDRELYDEADSWMDMSRALYGAVDELLALKRDSEAVATEDEEQALTRAIQILSGHKEFESWRLRGLQSLHSKTYPHPSSRERDHEAIDPRLLIALKSAAGIVRREGFENTGDALEILHDILRLTQNRGRG